MQSDRPRATTTRASRSAPKGGQKYIEGIEYPALLADAVEVLQATSPGVSSRPARDGHASAAPSGTRRARPTGSSSRTTCRSRTWRSQIVEGSLNDFRVQQGGALVGRVIADKLQLETGDTFEIENKGDIHHFRVSAIYQTGVNDIDSVRVYLKMDDARALFRKPTGATYLQVSLIDKDRAREDAAEMTNSLQHKADAWQDREKSWLGVFRAFRIATGITV